MSFGRKFSSSGSKDIQKTTNQKGTIEEVTFNYTDGDSTTLSAPLLINHVPVQTVNDFYSIMTSGGLVLIESLSDQQQIIVQLRNIIWININTY